MINKTIYEDGNGGQLLSLNNDIATTESVCMLAYLEMFGGNVEAKTKKENLTGEFRFDWWGNDTTKNSSTWVNSETEKILTGIELSGSSIAKIKQAVVNDLKSLQQYGTVEVSVTLPAVNQVKIGITIKEPTQKNSNTLILIWDATKNEIIDEKII